MCFMKLAYVFQKRQHVLRHTALFFALEGIAELRQTFCKLWSRLRNIEETK